MKPNLISALAVTAMLAAPAASPMTAFAQQRVAGSGGATFNWAVEGPDDGDKDHVMFFATEFAFDGETVKGAPYSADAVTETTQMLTDGNRIVRRNSSTIYRDSEGRTRREFSFGGAGFWTPKEGEPGKSIIITDPVAGVHYVLDVNDKVARKMPLPHVVFLKKDGDDKTPGEVVVNAQASDKGQIERVEIRSADQAAVGAIVSNGGEQQIVVAPRHPAGMGMGHGPGFKIAVADPSNAKEESLGKNTIEGVECEGTRVTMTIPAGQIGNERPIDMVTEQWYSPELKTMVLSKHIDPQFGETVYKLTNINRSEPAKSLFEVPADYKIDETNPGNFRVERKIVRKNPNE